MKKFLTLLFLFTLCNSHASILWAIPSPMAQGGMIHIDVVFEDTPTNTFAASLEPGGPPEMRSLNSWSPGSTFDPTAPWFDALDPSQEARLFGSRWGFRVVVEESDFLPSGTSIGIRMLNSTPGLESYFYSAAGAGTFTPVFLSSSSHDYVLWNGTMWHPVFTMPNNTPENFTVTAEFEFFLADQPSSGVNPSTLADSVPGYATSSIAFSWQAIPEPSAALLALLAIPLWMLRRRPATR